MHIENTEIRCHGKRGYIFSEIPIFSFLISILRLVISSKEEIWLRSSRGFSCALFLRMWWLPWSNSSALWCRLNSQCWLMCCTVQNYCSRRGVMQGYDAVLSCPSKWVQSEMLLVLLNEDGLWHFCFSVCWHVMTVHRVCETSKIHVKKILQNN